MNLAEYNQKDFCRCTKKTGTSGKYIHFFFTISVWSMESIVFDDLNK